MADNTYRLTISYNTGGQFAQNVLHYKFNDGAFTTTVNAAAALNAAFDTHCTAKLKDALSVHTLILSYKSRRVSAAGGFEAVKLFTGSDVGTRTGDLSASGLAPYIRFLTLGVPPKSGRMFLPGVSDDDCNDSYVLTTLFGKMETLAQALDDPITLSGGGAPVATPVLRTASPIVDSIPISVCVSANWLGTQRRRQRPA